MANKTSTETKTVHVYTVEEALKCIEAAKAGQGKANNLWFTAQRAAVYMAYKAVNAKGERICQLSPLTQLVQAVVDSKTLRARELIRFVVQMSGGDALGNGGCIRWNEKSKSFRKGTAEWTDNAVRVAFSKSVATPWYDWAKPASTNAYNFNALYAAIRRAEREVANFGYTPSAEEKVFLVGIQDAANKAGLVDRIMAA